MRFLPVLLLALCSACAPAAPPTSEPAPLPQQPTPDPVIARAETPDPSGFARTSANDGNVILSGVPEVPAELHARLAAYGQVRGATLSDWSEDGSAIYIATRFANVAQLHRVAMPGGARRQLTFFDEPVSGATRRPGSEQLLYSMDAGGNEFSQLFLLDPATGRSTRLTDGESRNSGALWSRDGSRLAFTSTRRDRASNDVWIVTPEDTAGARVLLEARDGHYFGASDWSPRSDWVLVTEYVSVADSRIWIVDVQTGEGEPFLGGDEAPASFGSATFDRSGDGIYFTTDARGEFHTLFHFDIAGRAWHPITDDIPWDVETVELSEDRTRAAFTVNENGRSRLYLLDPVTFAKRAVDALPVGLVGRLEFSPDGRRLAMTLNTATSPSDVYTLELGAGALDAGALTRWTESEVGGLNPGTFVEPQLVEYRTFDDRMIPAWLYVPRGAGPHPVIVSIHGGPEGQSRPSFSSNIQSWVNELGTAVVLPNVRGSSGYGKTYLTLDNDTLRENSVRDIGALLDWIATRAELDEDRVVVYGGSYGGYMVLASLVHYSDRLAGGVDIVGISDFRTFLENTESYRRDLRRVEYGDERDPVIRAYFDRVSPLRQASSIRAPLFVVQGQNDPRVPVTEAEQIVAAVRASGLPVWYMNALNEGHGYARKENQDLLRDLTAMFVARVIQRSAT